MSRGVTRRSLVAPGILLQLHVVRPRQLCAGGLSILRSEVSASVSIVDPHAHHDTRSACMDDASVDFFPTRPIEYPSPGRCVRHGLSAVAGWGLLPGRLTRVPDAALTGWWQVPTRNTYGRPIVIGVAFDVDRLTRGAGRHGCGAAADKRYENSATSSQS